ncbi:prolipoprotein diacylglyceryl transferase [Dethiobacter alkaliphilus]|uniref:Phosphatidylglycerol--prolipoprotein diacylglyceryl transferase n=1 Tax=Dethiobacter alkaliphilus AHT 1 TaxID=555088 RepID=C0GFZ0_DETAL|nr:prolipoprotein diacylglyceryl transferase [Dethiobacter alkaliphilus]EEG77679.1 prolipoprotein diacylglyceryl transferase [Dethiobacter alkaliphilus AHT 1]
MHIQIDPVAFRLFGLAVYWYGVMITLGIFAGMLVAKNRAPRYGIAEDRVLGFLLLAVPMAIAGARFIFVVTNLSHYGGDWLAMFDLRGGGLSIHGGILGGVLAAVLYTWRTGISFWRLGDVCAPGLILGQAIGRWGNFFNQEAYGIETGVPWALYIDGAMRHPIFFYEFIWNLGVFAFLLYKSKGETVAGGIFLRYLIWYSAGRFWIEGIRADVPYWGGMPAGQVVSLILIHGGLLVLWYLKRRAKQSKNIDGGIYL